jgi:hypothetical protein
MDTPFDLEIIRARHDEVEAANKLGQGQDLGMSVEQALSEAHAHRKALIDEVDRLTARIIEMEGRGPG